MPEFRRRHTAVPRGKELVLGANSNRVLRFGVFEADLDARELRKHGLRIKLQDQPFQVLALLLERPGQIVAREELQSAIWPNNTFVEFDLGLNKVVQKLRSGLGDSATNPRFIETIPRRGYRFIAPVQKARPDGGNSEPVIRSRAAGYWRVLPVAAVIVAGAALSRVSLVSRQSVPQVFQAAPLTTYPGSELNPSLSPSGEHVAFSWDGVAQVNRDIYIKPVAPGDPLRLTFDPSDDDCPSWSPDGRWIAFLRWRPPEPIGDVMLISALGGEERKVGETTFLPLGFPPSLSWSSDSQWLVILRRLPGGGLPALFRLHIDTGELHQLTFPEGSGVWHNWPAISPDGGQLAFTQEGELYVAGLSSGMQLLGAPRRLTSDSRLIAARPVWTADGRELLYFLYRGGGEHELRRIPTHGSVEPTPLVLRSASAPAASISRRGRRLTFSQQSRDRNVWRLELENGREARNAPAALISSTRDEIAAEYSPDGSKIVFSSNRSGTPEIWTCLADGSNLRRLTAIGGGTVGSPRWSPDGSRIAFDVSGVTPSRAGDVYLVPASGGPAVKLTDYEGSDGVPSWSRDGEWVYFYSDRGGSYDIWKQKTAGAEAIRVTQNGGRQGFESPDGTTFYFVKDREARLWRMPLAIGGEEENFLNGVRFLRFAVTESGIYFLESAEDNLSGTIKFYSFETGEVNTIIDIGKPTTNGMSVSADGRWLIYTQEDTAGSDLMIVEGFE